MQQLNSLVYHALIAGGIIVVCVLMTRLVRTVLTWIGRKFIARSENVLDDKILDVLMANVRPLMIVTGIFIAIREVHKGLTADDVTLAQMLDYADALLYIVGVVLAVKIFLGIIREIINWRLDRISTDGTSNLKMTLGPLTNKVVDILIGLVAIIIVLDHFSINIGSLLVSLGVGSLAVALAAQDTLANMIAGFVILVDRPFRVGDRIELIPGNVGDVLEIGLRSTRVLNFDNNVIIIPNADLTKGRIINHAYPQAPMRVLLKFAVALGTEPERIRTILLEVAGRHPDVLRDPVPQVFVTGVTETAVEVTLVARCTSFNQQFATETTLREQAYLGIVKAGIEVPVARRIIRMEAKA
jgi:small-conductance mechanosensitive channel